MGSINASLAGAASALDALQYALNVSQNNIDNASTPGYARQTANLQAGPFDPAGGLSGGVLQGPVTDSRDFLAESEVWRQSGGQGAATAQNEALTYVQNALPTSEGSGIPAALTAFFSAASAWSASPNNGSTAQNVMDAAASLAQSFNTTAAAVANVSQSLTQGIGATVSQINALTGRLANLNAAVQNGGQHDAGLSAQVYSTLETLSGLVNIQVFPQAGGSVNVTLAGGQALVMGTTQYQLVSGSVAAPASPPVDTQASPHVAILSSDGTDVTSQINSGTLAGQLQVRNTVIPGLIGDAAQTGALNQLASSLASTVNSIVSAGFVSTGVPAACALFTTDPTRADSAAATLSVDPQMSASGLPAIQMQGSPPNQVQVANGVPQALAGLATTTFPFVIQGSQTENVTFMGFYGDSAAQIGSQLNLAQSNQTLATQSLSQARSMRQTTEGVDLNAEAVNVLQLQQGFQATAKIVNTLDTMIQALINMMP